MAKEMDLDDVWVLCRDVLENSAPLELNDAMRALLSRTAQQVAISQQDAEDALEGTEALMGMILSRFQEAKRRFLRAMFRMTSLRDSGDIEVERR